MPALTDERQAAEQEGIAHRVSQRQANKLRAATNDAPTDAQGLVEFACECARSDCERTVRVPIYVYRRIAEADDQYLLQAGHHAFPQYRTIVSLGLVRIEERVR